jgi:hypothetical protein
MTTEPTADLSDDTADLTCQACNREITEAEYDENDGWCNHCHDLNHFQCDDCEDVYSIEDRHGEHTDCCEGCGCERNDKVSEQLRELVEAIIGKAEGKGNHAKVRKAIEVLKAARLK